MEVFFLLFGVAALIAVSDMFSSDSEPEPEDEDRITGTEDNDLIFTDGGQIVEALGGDDTIISVGEDTVFAGPGDDLIIAQGAATILGQEGDDIFAIAPETLEANDEQWPVVGDFNPEEDTLILDLREVDLGEAGTEETPIILTGVAAPDGEGMVVQANGFNLVQLSNYGSDDPQAALEALVTDFEAFALFGAAIEFPEDPDALPEGVDVSVNDDQIIFSIREEYAGGGALSVPDEFDPLDFGVSEFLHAIDLSNLSDDTLIIFGDDRVGTLTVGDLPPTTLKLPLSAITFGAGNDTIDLRQAGADDIGPSGLIFNATEGTNSINIGQSIDGAFNLSGGENTVIAAGGEAIITGGQNTLIDADSTTNNALMIRLQISPDNETTVSGTEVNLFVVAEDNALLDTVQVVRDDAGGGVITWDGGSFTADNLRTLGIQTNGTLAT
ncbi:MAG: hypothetical protein EA407_11225 [Rhodobacteraceae bacterium]|nr:MAG: hypothetical protein EA407_11225 [Paracoccaceae bacterium]